MGVQILRADRWGKRHMYKGRKECSRILIRNHVRQDNSTSLKYNRKDLIQNSIPSKNIFLK